MITVTIRNDDSSTSSVAVVRFRRDVPFTEPESLISADRLSSGDAVTIQLACRESLIIGEPQ